MNSSLEQLGRAWLQLFAEHKRLFLLEAKLARLSLIPLIACVLFIFITALGLWLSLLTLVGFVAYYYLQHILLALIAVLIFGLLCSLLFVYLASVFYSQLLFRNTVRHVRKYHQQYLQAKKANKAEQSEH